MPIIPSVFQPIKQNDVQHRPIKTYKRYKVSNVGFTTESGYFRHDAIYRDHVPHIFADTGQGVGSRVFPVNSEDQTNKHVVWNTIDHRYYRSFTPDKAFDFTDIEVEHRFLWYSASIFTAPYGQVGEKIKHGTFEITSSIGGTTIELKDDGRGNLRDSAINTSSFASASRNFFYMSFNDAYRRFNDYDELGSVSNNIRYELNHISKYATTRDNITITNGIGTTGFRPIIGAEIIRNGDFATAGTIDSTSYNLGFHSPDSPSSNITIASNLLNLNNPSGGGFDGRAYLANTAGTGTLFLPLGKFYRLTYTIAANSSGASLFLYDADNYNAIDNSVGTHTHDFTPHSDGSPIVLRNGTDNTNIQFSSISLREILVPKCGLAASISDGENIRIPHDTKFDRFGKCDNWSISFWYMTPNTASLVDKEVITKYALRNEIYVDAIDGKRKTRDVEFDRVTNFNNVRTPFSILAERSASNKNDSPQTSIKFVASDGTDAFTISSSKFTTEPFEWNHVLIRNSASLAQIFIDGIADGQSGSLPTDPTLNEADVLIGSPNNTYTRGTANNQFSIAELRMYDYAVESNAITSLASNDYYSGSLSQTNVAGNVFYKNGQAVVSSPWPKYNSGSGVFGNTFNLTYRGTHTLYENEVLVRVPKDTFNVTMNPTATFRPLTVGDPCLTTPVNGGYATERDVAPGELRKSLFVSGTLKPYITTIGLYDDQSRMLATAKLSTPVQKLDNVDMNFIVRWDY